jgi:hypothetical protein
MRFLLTIIVLFLLAISVSAQWHYGGVQVTDQWRTSELSAQPDANGNLLLSWSDYRAGGDGSAYIQKIDSSGHVLWTEFGLSVCSSEGRHIVPVAVSDGAAGALVAWLDIRSPDINKIYGQRISSNGSLIWPDTGLTILENEGPDHVFRTAISDEHGGMIVQWYYPAGVQRIDSSGVRYFGDNGLKLTDSSFIQLYGTLCESSDECFISTWMDERGLYAQKFTLDGQRLWNPQGTPAAIAPAAIGWADYRTSPAPGGGLYVIWADSAGQNGVRMQWIDGQGNPRWGSAGMAIFSSECTPAVAMTTNFDGRALVAWQFFGTPEPLTGSINLIDTTGIMEWPNHLALNIPIVNLYGITQSVDGQFEIGVEIPSGFKRDRLIKYDMQHGFVWGDTGISYSVMGNGSKTKLVSDAIGGAFIAWQMNPTDHIFVNRVYSDGWVAPDSTDSVNDDITLPREVKIGSYPNPFNASTLLILNGLNNPAIEIYDITGRLITTLHTIGGQALWDASTYSSGLYFARVAVEKASTIKLVLVK